MNLETFFKKFDLFASAPDAVPKMRELVLQLAVHGKLVHQNLKEGDADALLQAIFLARKTNGRHKTAEAGEDIELPEADQWYDIPASWRWVRFGVIGDIVGGGTPRSENSEYFAEDGIPWLTPADLNGFKEKRIFRGRRCITQLGLDNSSAQLLPEGSVLFSSRAPIGYVAISGTELATNQGFKSCVPFVKETNEFLYYYLKSAAARIDSEAPGTTFREVSGKLVSQIPVPLPPLAEQKRIVAKVDELMALCDRLEAQQKERETRHAALAHASLARFADAPTSANLHFIFHKSYDIPPADLRKSILTLAVQGKLVAQDPNDEPAEQLLAQIASSKVRLQTTGTIGKDKPVNPVDLDSLPFQVPESWCWAKLAEVTELITKGSSPKWQGIAYLSGSEGVLFITSENVGNYRLRKLDDLKYVEKRFNEIEPRSILKSGDILMNLVGASIGRTAVYDLHDGANINQAVALIRLVSGTKGLCPSFLLHYLNSPFAVEYMLSSRVVNAQPNISLTDAREFAVPVPPLAEQRRIVAKVDELMTLVDALETQLATARTTADKLLEAVVAELTGRTFSRERQDNPSNLGNLHKAKIRFSRCGGR